MVVLSNKENWLVYPEEIARRLNISREMVLRHFKKIEKAGYLRTVKKKPRQRARSSDFQILLRYKNN